MLVWNTSHIWHYELKLQKCVKIITKQRKTKTVLCPGLYINMAQRGVKSILCNSNSSFPPINTDVCDHICLSIKQRTRSIVGCATKESLKQCTPEKTWFSVFPQLCSAAARVYHSASSLWSFTLLPHLSLAANTQLLGYLSRAPIKGCHSGLQCPWANHIRAPAHASPAAMLPFNSHFNNI